MDAVLMIFPRGRPFGPGFGASLPRSRLHREKEPARVDVVHEVPTSGVAQQRPHAYHAGVVHKHIEPAESLDGERLSSAGL
jgi:hypothetical protein